MRWRIERWLNHENVKLTLSRLSWLFESWLLFYIERIVFLMKMIMFNSIQVINYWFTLHRALRSLYQQAQTFSPNIWGISDQDVTLRQSVIISRFIQSSFDGKSITKSMNIFCQILFNTGKDFKKLCQQFFQLLFIWHLSQFQQNVQMFCNISDQKNCYDKRTLITFLFECSVIVESCVY